MSFRRLAGAGALAATLLALTSAPPHAASTDVRLRSADLAWDVGDFPAALRSYLEILDAPHADGVLPHIALQTGELYRTTELTADGAAPRFSPAGGYLSYEVGRGASRRTVVAAANTPRTASAGLPGYGAVFQPDDATVAYLTPSGPKPGATASLVMRELASGREQRLDTGSTTPTTILAGAGGLVLFGGADAEGIEQIYATAAARPPRALTSGVPGKSLHSIDPTGSTAIFIYRTAVMEEPAFAIVRLPSLTLTRVAGSAPALSADGRRIAFVREQGGVHELVAGAIDAPDAAAVVRAATEPLGAPALSPDGLRLAFQMRTRDDWDLHVVGIDGRHLQRVTREIQHDVAPRFLDSHRLLGLVGEPRHRRSFVYDLSAGSRTRLFHNNTVRTIAPEYQWVAHPDGSRLLVVADRDGDTVSPQRGVYLVDLRETVTAGEVRERLRTSLAVEESLRARGRRLFAPIAATVRRILADASIARIYEYQRALFAFDSKHISQPGNGQASRYLFDTYASFGYEPEYQWLDVDGASGGRTANVLARLGGTLHPEIVYVVSSHYDSVVESPGADDNSSGTAALLETARLLAPYPQAATIVFVSFTGEESGLLGSREFVRRARAAKVQVAGALNNDMIGWTDDHRLDNTIRYGSPGIRDIQHAAALQFTRLVTYDARYFRGTDAHAFFEAYGEMFGGLGSYPILANPQYHEPGDVLAAINHRLVTEAAKTTAASIVLLASSPAPVTGPRILGVADGAARLSWAANRERDIVGYVLEWEAPDGQAARRRVDSPSAVIPASNGTTVSIRALNRQGLESWDSARITIE